MSYVNLFDIQHFCTDDGPGIRTTVFMKGCPLRCKWCHNPESQTSGANLLYYPNKCLSCGLCVEACALKAHSIGELGHTIDRSLCEVCGDCASVCANNALSVAGKRLATDTVIREIAGDLQFYIASQGGVTFSGGEPLMQPDALIDLLERCAEQNIKTAVETCSYASPEVYRRVFGAADMMICDIKAISTDLHKEGTGVGSELILANLSTLFREYKGRIWIRIPVIPNFNDTVQEFEKIAEFLKGKPAERVELLPFHPVGVSKYHSMGKASSYSGADRVSEEKLKVFRQTLMDCGAAI